MILDLTLAKLSHIADSAAQLLTCAKARLGILRVHERSLHIATPLVASSRRPRSVRSRVWPQTGLK